MRTHLRWKTVLENAVSAEKTGDQGMVAESSECRTGIEGTKLVACLLGIDHALE